MLHRREYNRRVREVVEASWLASSAAEAPEPALENGHTGQQQPEPAAAAGVAQQVEQAAEAADAVAEPQAKRQKVDRSAADTQKGSEAQAA